MAKRNKKNKRITNQNARAFVRKPQLPMNRRVSKLESDVFNMGVEARVEVRAGHMRLYLMEQEIRAINSNVSILEVLLKDAEATWRWNKENNDGYSVGSVRFFALAIWAAVAVNAIYLFLRY